MSSRIALLVCLALPGLLHAQLGGLGVFGDSMSDEYFDFGLGYAKNWVEQAKLIRNVNVGQTATQAGQAGGTWGSPRNTGYAANWALAGATSSSLLGIVNSNSAAITAQVSSGQITHAVVAIGTNDFSPGSSAWSSIYNGLWSVSQIQTYRDSVVANITATVTALQNKGIKVVVASVADYSVAPATRAGYPDAAKRELVTAAVADVNTYVKLMAQNKHIAYADLFGMTKQVFGTNAAPNATVTIGGVVINLNTQGTAPTNAFAADGIHPQSLLQGSLGSLYLEALRAGYSTGVAPLTEQEVVQLAGLTYTGDTLPFTSSQFVVSFVPEPASVAMVSLAVIAGLGYLFWRRAATRRALDQQVA
ncbi:MAG: SGNH/GDSL hydrolase family protein [Gemmatales bacterium]